ncbi:30S ribosomal protein S17, chloroplastic-like [Panicum miliaceum]|uniref:Small ribosomal subunit protein uS17c n=1 Tax=Panicum miliaceum TaxID=4540 RepID=A0A3L6RXD3_PANMI|nr:30S ribosomal protein S17, chloroplastic-like [Panicum miliaceum]
MLLSSPLVSPALRFSPQQLQQAGNGCRLRIEAAKQLTGRVVTTKADKTVGVEVVRLAPHPKYKRRERIKKKYQAHDPDNQFKVGDVVELRSSRPISKTKHFIAVPLPPRDTRRKSQLLPPLQSQQAADDDDDQQPPPPSRGL